MDIQEIKNTVKNWIDKEIKKGIKNYPDYLVGQKLDNKTPLTFSEWLEDGMSAGEEYEDYYVDVENFLLATGFYDFHNINYEGLPQSEKDELQSYLDTALDEADEEYRGYREKVMTTEEATGKTREQLMEDYLEWYEAAYDAGGKVDAGDAIVQDDFRRFLGLKSEPKDFSELFMELEEESGNNPNPEYPTEEEEE